MSSFHHLPYDIERVRIPIKVQIVPTQMNAISIGLTRSLLPRIRNFSSRHWFRTVPKNRMYIYWKKRAEQVIYFFRCIYFLLSVLFCWVVVWLPVQIVLYTTFFFCFCCAQVFNSNLIFTVTFSTSCLFYLILIYEYIEHEILTTSYIVNMKGGSQLFFWLGSRFLKRCQTDNIFSMTWLPWRSIFHKENVIVLWISRNQTFSWIIHASVIWKEVDSCNCLCCVNKEVLQKLTVFYQLWGTRKFLFFI